MLHFRKMNLDDLQLIYGDSYLKPLLTVPPIGEKFGVIVHEDDIIKGGLTGYTHGQGAMFQMLKVKAPAQQFQLKEGLLRAAIYMLDMENIKVVFSKDDMGDVYARVGFSEAKDLKEFAGWQIGKLILDDIGQSPFIYLDVARFFDHSCY